MLKNDEEMDEAKRKRIELMKHLKYHDKRFKNCLVGCNKHFNLFAFN